MIVGMPGSVWLTQLSCALEVSLMRTIRASALPILPTG